MNRKLLIYSFSRAPCKTITKLYILFFFFFLCCVITCHKINLGLVTSWLGHCDHSSRFRGLNSNAVAIMTSVIAKYQGLLALCYLIGRSGDNLTRKFMPPGPALLVLHFVAKTAGQFLFQLQDSKPERVLHIVGR